MRTPARLALLPVCLISFACAGEAEAVKKKPKPIPPNPEKIAAGMEGGSWSLESWGNSGSAEKKDLQGRQALKLIYTGGEKDKTAFKHLTQFGADPKGKAVLHVFVPDSATRPPEVGVAVSTTLAYVWHESRGFALKPGWNRIEVPLGAPHWKTQKTGWKFTAGIGNLGEARAVDIILHNGKETGWVLVEGMRFDPDERGKQIDALIAQLMGDDFEARAKAEKALIEIGRPALEALYQVRNANDLETILRVGFAVRQIEAIPEELPEDPELKKQIVAQREQEFLDEAVVRVDYILKGLENERGRVTKLLTDAAAELARGREAFTKLEVTDEARKAAFKEQLDRLETISAALKKAYADLPDFKAEAEALEKKKEEARLSMEAVAQKEMEMKEAAEREKRMAEKTASAGEKEPPKIPDLNSSK